MFTVSDISTLLDKLLLTSVLLNITHYSTTECGIKIHTQVVQGISA